MTERQRGILKRHARLFHSLSFMLEEESVRTQCDDTQFPLLQSILAVQREVEAELFDFTKRMMAKHGYRRYSGMGHWVTIEIPGVRQGLIESGLLGEKDDLPVVFVFSSSPRAFLCEVWLYKNKPLYSKVRGKLSRFSSEGPEPNRGDEHLVEVLFRRTIIPPAEIINKSLPELKEMIAGYFESDLKGDLAEVGRGIAGWQGWSAGVEGAGGDL